MTEIYCPYCKVKQNANECNKSWTYKKSKVQRFECKCGKYFNFYQSEKTSWTIPKNPKKVIEKFRY